MRMWANNSRGQKSHAGLMFLEYSVVFGLILNLIATIDFKDFYLKQRVSLFFSVTCFLSIMMYILLFAWNTM